MTNMQLKGDFYWARGWNVLQYRPGVLTLQDGTVSFTEIDGTKAFALPASSIREVKIPLTYRLVFYTDAGTYTLWPKNSNSMYVVPWREDKLLSVGSAMWLPTVIGRPHRVSRERDEATLRVVREWQAALQELHVPVGKIRTGLTTTLRVWNNVMFWIVCVLLVIAVLELLFIHPQR